MTLIGVEQLDSLTFVVLVGGAHNTPRLPILVDKFNARVHCLLRANHFHVNCRIAAAIVDVDASRDEAAKFRLLQ